jgi:hypothetical protein
MAIPEHLSGAQKLAWHNRRLIAERLKWPAGALETCEQLELDNPTWRFDWHGMRQVFTVAHATRHVSFRYAEAATVDELIEKMIDLDARAAAQLAEWQRFRPRGWSVLSSQ